MVEATPSYKERIAAARAAARAERLAREQAWKRQLELHCEVRHLALDAVEAAIRARGDKLQLYTPAQLQAQADAMIGPWLVAQARARIARRAQADAAEAEQKSQVTFNQQVRS